MTSLTTLRLTTLAFALAAGASSFAATTATVQSGPGTVVTFNSAPVGAAATPWTLSESITAIAPFIVRLDNTQNNPVGPTNTSGVSPASFSFAKWFSTTVTNTTSFAWTSFDLELQSVLGTASTDGDGLSFAQGNSSLFTSDKFSTVHAVEDVRDFLNFDGGSVGIGESVTFHFVVSDNTARNTFYLQETPNRVVGAIPEPETYAMLLAGLGVMGLLARRRRSS